MIYWTGCHRRHVSHALLRDCRALVHHLQTRHLWPPVSAVLSIQVRHRPCRPERYIAMNDALQIAMFK